ncbi:MAG: GxxExxY protein [Mariprofundus sp.]|nr:GxxExxY protein [Mariprofundus sp.]
MPSSQINSEAQQINDLSRKVLDAAMIVHTALGPGLLESAYEHCLLYELRKHGIHAMTQVQLPIIYDNQHIDAGYRIDMLVENRIIVELKAVERLLPIHEAQLLSYLKLADKRLGLLINFNISQLRHGIKRMVNDF